jgi:hypothetical protein
MSKDNGIELRVESYCAFCPDFEARVEKADITVMMDPTPRAITTIRCENAEKCVRLHERLRREQECKENSDGTK